MTKCESFLTKLNCNLSNFTQEQFLVDCGTPDKGLYGCNGGDTRQALDFVVANGMFDEETYPYTSGYTWTNGFASKTPQSGIAGTCKATTNPIKFTPKIYAERYAVAIPEANTFGTSTAGNCTRLKQLLTKGPVIVGMDATNAFKPYKPRNQDEHIFPDTTCMKDGTCNHAVVVVAFFKNYLNSGKDVFKVRNSWGLDNWGDKGHFYVIANEASSCSICTSFAYFA